MLADNPLVQRIAGQPVLYWFRTDLRLHDNLAWTLACRHAGAVVPVVCEPSAPATPWGFERVGHHRRAWLAQAVADLEQQLAQAGVLLLCTRGDAAQTLPLLAAQLGITHIVCEAIAAPEELDEINAITAAGLTVGLTVHSVWQSSLLHPSDLPFQVEDLPAVFTDFRRQVEQAGVRPRAPLPACFPQPVAHDLAALMAAVQLASVNTPANGSTHQSSQLSQSTVDTRSAFPYSAAPLGGGERAACAHVQQYLARQLPHTYKATRNGLIGLDYSSKWSPWLATGALSPRWAYAQLQQFEAAHGASDSSYWLWFELLWRDYFRFLHLQHASSPAKLRWLYRYQGLLHDAARLPPQHAHHASPLLAQHKNRFQQWTQGHTGQPLVDAGMRELAATGYLGNRMRQIVASYWVHELEGDWRAGAAWFESQLLDYDVYSNQGNWLYIAGRGTDPRGGRRFNPVKQTQDHDPQGDYRRLWGTFV